MDLKSEILYQYPFPIAVTYLNADNARETIAAHDQRIRLFEVTLKFLGSIAIAQYLRDRMEDVRVRTVLRGLVRPSLGQWNGFLREILSAYQRANRVDTMFVAGLFDAYNRRRQDRPAIVRAYNEITNFLDNRTNSATTSVSLRQFCDAMVSYRNKTVGHGVVNRYHCEQINGPLFDALEEMLGQLDFLKEHRLVYVEQVRVRRGSYAHEMMSFMGSTPPARMKEAYVTDQPEEYRVEEQLYLCRRGKNVPVLSLHPLVISWQGDILFLNESERESGIEYLSYISGQVKKPDRLLQDFNEVLGFVLGDELSEPSFETLRRQTPDLDEEPEDYYERGCEAYDRQAWTLSIQLLSQVGEGEPSYDDAQEKLDRARRQQDLEKQYALAQRLLAARQWDQAESTLQALQQAESGYRDVATRLDALRVERAQEASQLRLYNHAQEALAGRRWERAYELLRRLHELRPDFRDVPVMYARHEQLRSLYERAIESLSAQRWAEAQTVLRQIKSLEPAYKDLPELLARAEHELEVDTQLAAWYSQARSHLALKKWEEALALLDRIDDQRPAYRDVDQLIAQVQAELSVTCSKCGHLVPAGLKFCGRCGTPVEFWVCWRCQAPVAESRKFCGQCGAPRRQPELAICPHCGNENARGRRFCGRCGTLLGTN